LRFLLDENVPATLAKALRERGHDAAGLDVSLRAASDLSVLAAAARDDRILLTQDKDFGDLVFVSRATPPPAVVLIRLGPV
jgi:predicted nuclease of predicted toxin-antitoxin system